MKAIAGLALVAFAAGAILIGSLWVDHTRETNLPTPTGHFRVGRTTLAWTDEKRLNRYAPAPDIKQELGVWIWYPAAPTASSKRSEYLPEFWRRALVQHEGFILGKLLSRDLTRIQTHSWTDAAVSAEQGSYPVVILRAGGGALSTDYTSIAEDLASHGYIVVSFDAPYRTVLMPLQDGRIAKRAAKDNFESMPHGEAEQFANQLVNAWIEDVQFVLDKLQQLNAGDPTSRFSGRLNLQEIGIVGHSLGGATAAQFCHDDARCKAGIDIDGMPFGSVIQDGLRQPFFFIMSDHSRESGPEGKTVEHDIESIYSKLPPGKRWEVTITGANHFTFSDQMLTKSPIFVALLRRLGVFGSLDKRRGLAITNACVHSFFDVYLKGAPAGSMESLSVLFPEVKPGVTEAFSKSK